MSKWEDKQCSWIEDPEEVEPMPDDVLELLEEMDPEKEPVQ
jgi:hypothetical protein